MHKILILKALLLIFAALPAAAENLILPVFAYDVKGVDDNRWSSEIYLTNPSDQPVQVTMSDFLPGFIQKPAPCDLFMPPTRVVPPRSAVVWTASGLATDLGCARRALGGLVLNADGPVQITSRMVNHAAREEPPRGVLSGNGQEFEALPMRDLPTAGVHLLPALLWHRNACGPRAYETSIGFANPGPEPVEVVIDLPKEVAEGGVLLDDLAVELPLTVTVPAASWMQIDLSPTDLPIEICMGPQSFVAELTLSGPIVVYASVVDRFSQDPRTVAPVPLR